MARVAAAAPAATEVVQPYEGKRNIFNPNTVNFVPRTDFLQKLVGQIDQGDTLEEMVIKSLGRDTVTVELKELASFYVKIKNKGARVPNFARWITGMWAGNKDYANFLAKEGQKAAKRQIILSTELEDILRCADTKHFNSCFKRVATHDDARRRGNNVHDYDYFQYIPVHIAEQCPGIGIVYVDDEHGQMMGRQWMHHARLLDTAENICVLVEYPYGCLQAANLARLMAQKGIKVGVGLNHGDGAPIEYIGCFTENIHHDLNTWSPDRRVRIINP